MQTLCALDTYRIVGGTHLWFGLRVRPLCLRFVGCAVSPFALHEVWVLVENLRSYAKDLSECGQYLIL